MKYVITQHGQIWRESKFRARFYEPAHSGDSKVGKGHILFDRPDVARVGTPMHMFGHIIPPTSDNAIVNRRYFYRPPGKR